MDNIHPHGTRPEVSEDNALLIGKSFYIAGDITGQGHAVISGTVEGSINALQVMTTESAFITGDIRCEQLDAYGKIKGSIFADEVIIRKGANVEGDISYVTLAIEQGCSILGRLKVGPQTNKKDQFTPQDEKPFAPNSRGRATGIEISLLDAIPQSMISHFKDKNIRGEVKLTELDGSPAPAWIALDIDSMKLLMPADGPDLLKRDRESVTFLLQSNTNQIELKLS